MLSNALTQLGLAPLEAQMYLALAELGKASANTLARRALVPRSSCYSAVEALVTRGLAAKDVQSRTTLYSLHEPETLLNLIEEKRRRLGQEETLARSLMQELRSHFRNSQYSVPKLQFFEGSLNVKRMLDRYLDVWLQSMRDHDNVLWGYQDHTLVEEHRQWLEKYWGKKDPEHRIQLFSNRAEVEHKLRRKIGNRLIRPLPKGIELSSTIWISGEYLTLIRTREKPHYAFQIQDAVFADNLRRIFSVLWDTLAPRRVKS